ncbi:DUF2007 domain-containing protein [Flavobacterium sp. N2038]|uniref:putative signal transducing protein n=1 Tax=Flavobacterium sp. N2038 TaxID=2986829 RepID=UPI0022255E3B|nr:DUF2007 domain-containing protein [Flavobacterium sp. N2038]
MIEIFRGSHIEAINIKNLLENNDIPVFTVNEYMSSIQPWSVSAGGNAPVILNIREEDLESTKKIIDDYNTGKYDLDIK